MTTISDNSKTGRHVIITVHGINTFGDWQKRLETIVKDEDNRLEVISYNYGVFGFISFLLPPTRLMARQRFQKWLREQHLGLETVERVDFVGHSFGTHIIGHTIAKLTRSKSPILKKVNTIILAGSVLKSDFRWWDRLLREYPGIRVVNECGWRDVALIASQLVCVGTGMAGKVGFHGGISRRFRNHFHTFGHGGYFQSADGQSSDDFMRERWLPLLTKSSDEYTTPDGPDERPKSQFYLWWVGLLNQGTILKLVLWACLVATPIGIYIQNKTSWDLVSARLKNVELDNKVKDENIRADAAIKKALVAEKNVEIAEKKAAMAEKKAAVAEKRAALHFISTDEMIKATALSPLLENSITHDRARLLMVNSSGNAMATDLNSAETILDSLSLVNPALRYPKDFCSHVTTIVEMIRKEGDREAHALTSGMAQHWLLMNHSTVNDRKELSAEQYRQKTAEIDRAFEVALKWSKGKEGSSYESDRMFVNYTYGVVLLERGNDYPKAIAHLEEAIEHLQTATAQLPKIDNANRIAADWFHIHALASLADAYQRNNDWRKANKCLEDAMSVAALLNQEEQITTSLIEGQLHLARGWVFMSRSLVKEAGEEFDRAHDLLHQDHPTKDDPQAMDEYFWAWHGQIMVRHPKSKQSWILKAFETSSSYDSLIAKLKEFLEDEVRLTIRDRIELHERWLNSRERQGDSWILMLNDQRAPEFELDEGSRQSRSGILLFRDSASPREVPRFQAQERLGRHP